MNNNIIKKYEDSMKSDIEQEHCEYRADKDKARKFINRFFKLDYSVRRLIMEHMGINDTDILKYQIKNENIY